MVILMLIKAMILTQEDEHLDLLLSFCCSRHYKLDMQTTIVGGESTLRGVHFGHFHNMYI
jgi:hypothetical protein